MTLVIRIWFFVQAEDGIRDRVRSRGLGDVYKRQSFNGEIGDALIWEKARAADEVNATMHTQLTGKEPCLLYTSDAADERSSVDLGGRRIIKKKTQVHKTVGCMFNEKHV